MRQMIAEKTANKALHLMGRHHILRDIAFFAAGPQVNAVVRREGVRMTRWLLTVCLPQDPAPLVTELIELAGRRPCKGAGCSVCYSSAEGSAEEDASRFELGAIAR